jgi:hypothetical protein
MRVRPDQVVDNPDDAQLPDAGCVSPVPATGRTVGEVAHGSRCLMLLVPG